MRERTGTNDAIDERAWIDEAPRYRTSWEARGKGRWEDVEPGYRVGHELTRRPEHRGKKWDQVEPEFRREWQGRYPDKPWDRFLDQAQDVWDDLTREPGPTTHRGEEPRR